MGAEGLLNDKMMGVALTELDLAGLIEWDDDENFRLTSKGISYAWAVAEKLSSKDRLALFALFDTLLQVREIEEKNNG